RSPFMRSPPEAEGADMGAWFRLAALIAAPLLLAGCLLTPGKFTSKLTMKATPLTRDAPAV
ncbi:MAG TPA: hypothetical protein VFT73_02305, partial [Sphingomonas sp.]|nr:hypothetical protein [Sphingomonas sp.]